MLCVSNFGEEFQRVCFCFLDFGVDSEVSFGASVCNEALLARL